MWNWVKGATKVTVDKTLEVSKVAVDSSVSFAQSGETEKVLKDVGTWWEKDAAPRVGGWWNNVTTRATGGGKAKGSKEFPPAAAWTGEGGGEDAGKNGDGEEGGSVVGASKTGGGATA